MSTRTRVKGLAVAMAAVFYSLPAHASILITVDTTAFGSDPIAVGFTLVSGDGSVNTVTLSGFDFGGGAAVPGTADCSLGGNSCSGDLEASVVLQDLDPTVVFSQLFSPGSAFSFLLDSSNAISGPVPDQFAMFICSATICGSDDPSGALLKLDLVGGEITPASFQMFGFAEFQVAAPVATAVPEPSTVLLIGAGIIAAAHRRRSRS